MRNLAGSTTAHTDAYIEDELAEANIPAFRSKASKGEVPASLRGEHGPYRFERVWYYWVVHGPVPVELAWEMYEDPRGRYDVRIAGHCGCPEPVDPWIRKRKAGDVVDEYHIDSQDGLNLFAEKVLGTRPLPPTEEEKEAALKIARANRAGTVIYEDGLTEADMLAAQKEVQDIRRGISDLRSRLNDLSRGADRGTVPTDSIAHTVACSLTTAVAALYELENPSAARSFAARAKWLKDQRLDLYKNPTKYVLKEKRDG